MRAMDSRAGRSHPDGSWLTFIVGVPSIENLGECRF